MGICWYCHWGWPKATADIYKKYLPTVGESGLDFGPGHIVWSDENFETSHIEWCIENAEKYRGDLSDEELANAVASLKELLAVPENIRCCKPEEYDDEHPENFPPPSEIEMDRKRAA